MAQRWPPSLNSSEPLQPLCFPAPCTQAWTLSSPQEAGQQGPPAYLRAIREVPPGCVTHPPAMWGTAGRLRADPSCLSTLISGGIVQSLHGFQAWHGSRGRRGDWTMHPRREAHCPYPFLAGSLYWPHEPQHCVSHLKWGHLHLPHRERPEAPMTGPEDALCYVLQVFVISY